MLIASLLVAPLAFSEPFFVPDYWLPDAILNPKLSIEDFIFSFAVGGLAAVGYELFMGKHLKHYRLRHSLGGEVSHTLVLGIGLVTIFTTYYLFKINFMYAVYLGIVVNLILVMIARHDLIHKAIFSGIIFGIFYMVFFISFTSIFAPDFINLWNLKSLSGIILLGIPLEEIIWAGGIGALVGPLYEYVLGVKVIEKR